MRINFAEGAVIAILVPIVLLLVGVLSFSYTVTALLVLFGGWSIVFGVAMAAARERMYYASWGAILVALSTVTVLPIQYVVAALLVVIIVLVVLAVAMRRSKLAPSAGPA